MKNPEIVSFFNYYVVNIVIKEDFIDRQEAKRVVTKLIEVADLHQWAFEDESSSEFFIPLGEINLQQYFGDIDIMKQGINELFDILQCDDFSMFTTTSIEVKNVIETVVKKSIDNFGMCDRCVAIDIVDLLHQSKLTTE